MAMDEHKMKRVLVTWGTQRGGTEGIARIIGEVLLNEGFEVVVEPASAVHDLGAYDAAIIGGALYANRWHPDARRFVAGHVAALRRIPVWLFSSGPLDHSAERADIPPSNQVSVIMQRIGALGHTTFGGRLRADAAGFPAAAMAKARGGDWRNPDRVRAWALHVARALPTAMPGLAIDPPARSMGRLVMHGVVGWALCAAVRVRLIEVASVGVAHAVHAAIAPLVFACLAIHYFGARGAREPIAAALAWTAIVAALDAGIVAGVVLFDFTMFRSFVGTWLPFVLVLVITWLIGLVVSTLPWPKASGEDTGRRDANGRHGPPVSVGKT
jgi:menaquinone-dependent protoporphyrinogen oxidase